MVHHLPLCAFDQTTGENVSDESSERFAANVASNRNLRQQTALSTTV